MCGFLCELGRHGYWRWIQIEVVALARTISNLHRPPIACKIMFISVAMKREFHHLSIGCLHELCINAFSASCARSTINAQPFFCACLIVSLNAAEFHERLIFQTMESFRNWFDNAVCCIIWCWPCVITLAPLEKRSWYNLNIVAIFINCNFRLYWI
jgi:hypothetical protein